MTRLFFLRTVTAGILCGLLFALMLLALALAGNGSKREAFRWPRGELVQGVVERYRAGEHAGREFAKEWGLSVLVWAGAAAAGGAVAISFGGFLPWCRREELDRRCDA